MGAQQSQFLDKIVDEGIYIVLNKVVERVEREGEEQKIWVKSARKIARMVSSMLSEETKESWVSRLNHSPLEALFGKYLHARLEPSILDQMEQLKLSWINNVLLCTPSPDHYKLLEDILALFLVCIRRLQSQKEEQVQAP